MRLRVVTLLITVFLGFTAFAQEIDFQKLDSFVNHIESNERGVGSISIFKEGKEIYNRSFGQKYLGNIEYNNQTKYQIGSITKMVTASLVFDLIENNKLQLNDNLSHFFPDIPNANTITIKNLLEHSSGLGDYVEKKDGSVMWLTQPVSEKEIIKEILEQGVLFEPNEKVLYSNSAYYLLTKIVESLYGKSYASIVAEKIAKPLNLGNFTSYSAKAENIFGSYTYVDRWEKIKDFDFSNVIGVGDITTTTKELNMLLYNLFNYQIVEKESVEQMKPRGEEVFGRGVMLLPFFEHSFYGHTGGTYGTHSIVAYNPTDKLGIAISMNGVRFSRNNLTIALLSIIYGKEYQFPNFNSIILESEELDKYLGVYSNPSFPLKLTISKEGNALKGQGTGQPAFPLECYEENKFKFEQAGLLIEFLPQEKKLIFNQSGYTFELVKE